MRLPITRNADAARARLLAKVAAAEAGLDELAQAHLAQAVRELADNALRHAGGGTIEIDVIGEPGRQGVEVRCHDGGPGFADWDAAVAPRVPGDPDSHTRGLGLAACRRLVDSLELVQGDGTTIVARKWRPRS